MWLCGRFGFESVFLLFATWRRTGKHTISIVVINEESGQGGPQKPVSEALPVTRMVHGEISIYFNYLRQEHTLATEHTHSGCNGRLCRAARSHESMTCLSTQGVEGASPHRVVNDLGGNDLMVPWLITTIPTYTTSKPYRVYLI